MAYVKYTWANLPAVTTPISKANLDHLETQYDEADAELTTHEATPHMKAGLIVMWHGTIGNIPAGYLICDGNNATPNLLTRFVEGVATAATNPGATGGATAKNTAGHTHSDGAPLDQASGGGGNDGRANTDSKNDSIADIRPLFYDIAFLMKS